MVELIVKLDLKPLNQFSKMHLRYNDPQMLKDVRSMFLKPQMHKRAKTWL